MTIFLYLVLAPHIVAGGLVGLVLLFTSQLMMAAPFTM